MDKVEKKIKINIYAVLLFALIILNMIYFFPLIKGLINKTIFKGYKYMGDFEVTGYDNSAISINVEKWRDKKTSMNVRTHLGICAVDPRVIPHGSTILIEGMGYYFCCDSGALIKYKRLDIFFWTIREAREWGRRKRKVWIVKLK